MDQDVLEVTIRYVEDRGTDRFQGDCARSRCAERTCNSGAIPLARERHRHGRPVAVDDGMYVGSLRGEDSSDGREVPTDRAGDPGAPAGPVLLPCTHYRVRPEASYWGTIGRNRAGMEDLAQQLIGWIEHRRADHHELGEHGANTGWHTNRRHGWSRI